MKRKIIYINQVSPQLLLLNLIFLIDNSIKMWDNKDVRGAKNKGIY